MASWIRRSFSAPGLTQIPPGPHLRTLQGRFGGTVLLCIDISGSMDGAPISEAVRGAGQFVAEAVAAHYSVGVMLWNHCVEAVCEPTADGQAALAQMKAENIRFVTRGLGPYAAREFGEISDEEPSSAAIDGVGDLADGIAGMAITLKRAPSG
jgi:hypothetical protein